MASWKDAKRQRARQTGGWHCEKCGKQLTERTAIGHHKHYQRNGGQDTVDNCELRCGACEKSDGHNVSIEDLDYRVKRIERMLFPSED